MVRSSRADGAFRRGARGGGGAVLMASWSGDRPGAGALHGRPTNITGAVRLRSDSSGAVGRWLFGGCRLFEPQVEQQLADLVGGADAEWAHSVADPGVVTGCR